MKNSILLLLFFVSISFSKAQSLNGQVLDNTTNEPIEGVHVYTSNQKNVALTNKRGKFRLKIFLEIKENDTIFYSYLGYKIGYTIYSERKRDYDLLLIRDVNKLDEVNLLSNKKLKSFINYSELTPIDKGIYSLGSTLIDDKIYVFGGEETYNLDVVKQAFSDYVYIEGNGDYDLKEVFRGLKDFSEKRKFNSKIKVYDLESDSWAMEEPTTLRRSNHKVIYNKGKV
jgi:hypothetical protein